MKEAVGELNATVIVVMVVSLLALFFFFVLWPSIRNSYVQSARCSDAMCDATSVDSDGFANCIYKDKKGRKYDIKCVWKG